MQTLFTMATDMKIGILLNLPEAYYQLSNVYFLLSFCAESFARQVEVSAFWKSDIFYLRLASLVTLS